MKKKNVCGIGGQAVLEGVMMRGKNSYAIAVRNGEGEIVMESERPKVTDKKKKALKIPVRCVCIGAENNDASERSIRRGGRGSVKI